MPKKKEKKQKKAKQGKLVEPYTKGVQATGKRDR